MNLMVNVELTLLALNFTEKLKEYLTHPPETVEMSNTHFQISLDWKVNPYSLLILLMPW